MTRSLFAPGDATARHDVTNYLVEDGDCSRFNSAGVFIALRGRAVATVAGERLELGSGDALIVPPHTAFSLANPGDEPLEAVAALPVGGRAAMPAGEPFVPPWAV